MRFTWSRLQKKKDTSKTGPQNSKFGALKYIISIYRWYGAWYSCKRGDVMMKHTKKSKIPPLTILESHHAWITEMYVAFCPWQIKRDHFCVSFLCEWSLSRPHSPEEEEDKNTKTKGIDVDDAERGDFNEEEDTEEKCIGYESFIYKSSSFKPGLLQCAQHSVVLGKLM